MKKWLTMNFGLFKPGFHFGVSAIACLLFMGCSKQAANSSQSAPVTVTNNDMIQAVSNAVSGSSSGLATQSETTTQFASGASPNCGENIDTSVSASSPAGAIIAYSYNLSFNRSCICTAGVPTQYNTNISGSSSYSTILMSSNDSTQAKITVSGIQSTSSVYVLNETYIRKGVLRSSISNVSFNGSLNFTSADITVNKSSNKIVSGSADVSFSGTDFSGAAFSRTATITFLGNNQATLVLDGGDTNTIQW